MNKVTINYVSYEPLTSKDSEFEVLKNESLFFDEEAAEELNQYIESRHVGALTKEFPDVIVDGKLLMTYIELDIPKNIGWTSKPYELVKEDITQILIQHANN